MSRLGAKIRRQRAAEARVARRLIRELLPPPPASPAPASERLGGAEPHAGAPPPFTPGHPSEPAIAVLLTLILVALFGAVAMLGRC